jgi:hypothetical protein
MNFPRRAGRIETIIEILAEFGGVADPPDKRGGLRDLEDERSFRRERTYTRASDVCRKNMSNLSSGVIAWG